jgi:nicotinamide riboside kinase
MRAVFIGGPGSGKSTLASQVFSSLKASGRKVEHIHEFVRNDIHAHGPMTSIWEQYRTRQYQKELEDAVPNIADYTICDSGTLTPYFYAVLYANPSEPRQRLVLQDMYKYLLDDLYLRRYDQVFYVPLIKGPDIKDGTRYQSDDEIDLLDDHMRLVFTKLHRLDNIFHVQQGFDKRLEEVMWRILGVEKELTKEVKFDTVFSPSEPELEPEVVTER